MHKEIDFSFPYWIKIAYVIYIDYRKNPFDACSSDRLSFLQISSIYASVKYNELPAKQIVTLFSLHYVQRHVAMANSLV